jgi:hypothetical protein
MFDAEQALSGNFPPEVTGYWNGDLFNVLRNQVSNGRVGVERLIFVLNKCDLARITHRINDAVLRTRCLETLHTLFASLTAICSPDKVCEVLTVLDRRDLGKSVGANLVKGEAARGLILAVASESELRMALPTDATTHVARFFAGSTPQ